MYLKILLGTAVLAALMSGKKYDVIPQNGDCSRESNVLTLIIKRQRRYRNCYGKFHLQIMLPDVG
jgi:hypothetical protein